MKMTPWIMLVWLLLVQIMVAFVGRSIGPLAPFIAEGLELSKAQVGLLPAALFLGNAIISIPAGWYADLIGTRKMLLFISIILSLSILLASVSPLFYVVLFCLVLGGFGYGAMHPVSSRGIIFWFSLKQAGTAMGIKQMGVTIGSALAALVLIPLAVATDWRWAMGMSTIVLLIMGILSFLFYRDAPNDRPLAKKDRPLFWRMFRKIASHKPLFIVSFAAMGLTSAQLSLTTYLVFYSSTELLYPLVLAGVFLALSEVGGSMGRLAWGIISDRLFGGKRAPVLILIAVITAICSLSLAFVPPNFTLWILVPLVLMFGFSIAGYNGIWINFAAETVPREYAGIACGFSLAIGCLGVIVGPPIFGWIVDIMGGFTLAWIFISLEMIVVIGLLIWAERELEYYKKTKTNSFFVA
jgi:ACS family hexuronate transporter-like MFS transporter